MVNLVEDLEKNDFICDLRDLLTFVQSYKQMIDAKHPETKEFEHWNEMDEDLNAMAQRIVQYERESLKN